MLPSALSFPPTPKTTTGATYIFTMPGHELHELRAPARAPGGQQRAFWVLKECSSGHFLICQAAFDGFMKESDCESAVGSTEASVMTLTDAGSAAMPLKVVSVDDFNRIVQSGAGLEYLALSTEEKLARRF